MTRSGGTLLAVGVVGHHPDGHGGQETATFKHYYHPQYIFCYNNFPLYSLPGCTPDQALLLAVGVAGHHQDGHGG